MDLTPSFRKRFFLKCEGFNFAGSVKAKAALSMISAAEEEGLLRPGSTIVESSSGSLGVALAALAAERGYRFVCVTDTRCTERHLRMMRSYGAEVVVISEPDPVEGLLGARIRHVHELCRQDPGALWLNQYANDNNWRAHFHTTGPAIVRAFPDLDYLFIGAGTTGTLTGTGRYLKHIGHPARIVAVDSVGSVTFGGPPGTRHIPGLGTGRRPEIVDESVVDEVLMVPEQEAVRMCRALARRGYLLGGSTGTVLAGAWQRLADAGPTALSVGISPDLGERYLDSVYDDVWVRARFGDITDDDPLAPAPAGTLVGS
ncbi:2,3-diaminopropionate biosynthesis protein SbnA [Streptomyces mashuensis]|uniref:2,3-diaminopropionate biosynthesis protein SbnA n=1 Tax=Streptomyces mashuensis TaxID=33904 RepID=A0A919EF34_9ACTN|nr:2,3-diaminopropionate biosynthesis protein SbnA [Streptomyces mashuensis]